MGGDNGCPDACTQSGNYTASTMKPCVDESNSSAYFRRYVDGLRSMQWSFSANWVIDFDSSIQKIQRYGCQLIPMNISLSFFGSVWTHLCEVAPFNFISLTFACPVSCGCL